MITISLICVGNIKEKFFVDAEQEYLKRLFAFCKFNVIEIKEQNQLKNIDLIKQREGEEILKKLSGHTILCEIGGNMISSEDLANKITKLSLDNSKISFVIGGSYGVSQEVKNACHDKLSFSKMTFPHNLFRIMLEEQIYRAFTILNGKGYHK